jgi:general secretion pathway protein A
VYLSFFNLREHPFSLTPDPRFLFLSPQHEEALSHLLYGIQERKGFIEITGEVGTGKTILCRALLDRLDATVATALIFNSYLNELELLQAITNDFGLTCHETTRKGYIDALNQYLLHEFTAGRNAVVLIDEAQNLEPRVLEQLRMLSNLETERGKLLQVILVGQPELRDRLATPQMRQLEQRIAVRFHIQGLTHRETYQYISHRLSVAGAANAVTFSRRALAMIYRYCAGIPRRINLLCDRLLITAYVRNTQRITARVVRQSLQDLTGIQQPRRASWSPSRSIWGRTWRLGLAGIAVTGLLGGVLLHPSVRDHLALALPDQVLALMQTPFQPPPLPQPALVSPAAPAVVAVSPSPPQLPDAELTLARTLWQLKIHAEGEVSRTTPGTRPAWETVLSAVSVPMGLEVAPFQASFPQLQRLLRPCFIEIGIEPLVSQSTVWVLIRVLKDRALVYREPEGLTAVPLQELRRLWYGKLYLTLEEGKYRGVVLRQGMQGARVQAIQHVLKELGYFPDAPSGRFDAQTLYAVKGFQRDNQLVIDGHVGRQTLMVLWHFGGHILEETT